jgi:hypothetical protein
MASAALLAPRVSGQYQPEDEMPIPPAESPAWQEPEEDQGWQPQEEYQEDWREPVRRTPAPIPPARPLPFYPPEPPATTPPGTAVTSPPDFLGSAAGYLEIPVGQTATLLVAGARTAETRDPRLAVCVSLHPDRVLVRGLFPGRTLLDVQTPDGARTYLVRVR